MKERPILFSAPMVRAILEGRKTMTRRVVKPQPDEPMELSALHRRYPGSYPSHWSEEGVSELQLHDGECRAWRCPYGQHGDRLYVKETWRPKASFEPWDLDITYAADGAVRTIKDGDFGDKDWTMPKAAARGNVSPLFMPRWASRILLEVTDVRVERLQDISDADSGAEGIMAYEAPHGFGTGYPDTDPNTGKTPIAAFRNLWQSINGPDSWALNPWLWVVSFKRIES